jgi:hypothetical protein
MFDKNLAHAIVGNEDLDCGSAKLSLNLRLTRLGLTRLGSTCGHGFLLLAYDTSTSIRHGAASCSLIL